jgi:hypothetical protein
VNNVIFDDGLPTFDSSLRNGVSVYRQSNSSGRESTTSRRDNLRRSELFSVFIKRAIEPGKVHDFRLVS